MKILAGRRKDLEDVKAIVRAQGDRLDVGEIRGLLHLVEEALGQSDLVPAFDRMAAPPPVGKRRKKR